MSKWSLVVMVFVTFSLGACVTARPFDYKDPMETPQPGFLTGKSGEMTIYKSRTRR